MDLPALASTPGPPRPGLRALRTTAAGLAALVLGLGLLVGLVAPAHAHSELIGSDPADGEELDEAPAQIVLTYNENIEQIGADVLVTDADGNDVTDGEPQIDGPELTQQLTEELPAGEYAVQWRVVSADGHPISGEFGYSAAAGSASEDPDPTTEEPTTEEPTTEEPTEATTEEAEPADDPTPEPAETPGDAAGGAQDDGAGGLLPWGGIFALALAGVVLLLMLRARRQVRDGGEQDPPGDG